MFPPVYFKNQDVILVLCDCGCIDHHLVISKDKEHETTLYYIDIHHSCEFSFWGRVRYAIRYIFKGPWNDGIVLNKGQVEDLYQQLQEMNDVKNEQN